MRAVLPQSRPPSADHARIKDGEMLTSEHTARAFDQDLQELTRLVSEMGGLTEKQIADAVDALARRDAEWAHRIVEADLGVDALQRQIEDKAVQTIARRQPMAVDLRELLGALRLCTDLERLGDLAKNIAKRVIAVSAESYSPKLIRGVQHMAGLALAQLKLALDSYAGRDLQKAIMVWNSDKEIDAMCTSIFRELITYMMEDPRSLTCSIHLMFCAKNIERMGDHATNIAETVYYVIEGRSMAAPRPKGDTTSLLSPGL
jgi:phosphate transport system protein